MLTKSRRGSRTLTVFEWNWMARVNKILTKEHDPHFESIYDHFSRMQLSVGLVTYLSNPRPVDTKIPKDGKHDGNRSIPAIWMWSGGLPQYQLDGRMKEKRIRWSVKRESRREKQQPIFTTWLPKVCASPCSFFYQLVNNRSHKAIANILGFHSPLRRYSQSW